MTQTPFNIATALVLSTQFLFSSFYLFSDCLDRTLNFESAFQDIIESAHELKEVDSVVAAGGCARRQASAIPNPVLSVGMDNWGTLSRCDDEEQYFVGVTQLIELGGKRSARINLADAEQCVLAWDREIMKCEIFGQTLDAFITMAISQERLKLSKSMQRTAQEALACVKAKTESGKACALEMKGAEVSCHSVNLLAFKQQAALSIAKKQLRRLWDCIPPDFDSVEFPLYKIEPLPCLEVLYEALERNPAIAKAEAEISRAGKIIRLERSRRIPDIEVQVGVSNDRSNKPSVGFEIDIPLPIFDQNQGNICRAIHEQDAAIYNQMNVRCHHRSELAALYEEWNAAYKNAELLRNSILPLAAEWYQQSKAIYDEGKTEYAALLAARNTYFDIQQQYLDAVEEYHHKRADVLKLTCCMLNIKN